jgi:hypothetical protein
LRSSAKANEKLAGDAVYGIGAGNRDCLQMASEQIKEQEKRSMMISLVVPATRSRRFYISFTTGSSGFWKKSGIITRVILIDDGSVDRSLSIMEEIPWSR